MQVLPLIAEQIPPVYFVVAVAGEHQSNYQHLGTAGSVRLPPSLSGYAPLRPIEVTGGVYRSTPHQEDLVF